MQPISTDRPAESCLNGRRTAEIDCTISELHALPPKLAGKKVYINDHQLHASHWVWTEASYTLSDDGLHQPVPDAARGIAHCPLPSLSLRRLQVQRGVRLASAHYSVVPDPVEDPPLPSGFHPPAAALLLPFRYLGTLFLFCLYVCVFVCLSYSINMVIMMMMMMMMMVMMMRDADVVTAASFTRHMEHLWGLWRSDLVSGVAASAGVTTTTTTTTDEPSPE